MPHYIGKVCLKHPELKGERRNGNCPACQRERPKPKRSRASQRAKVEKWRNANRKMDEAICAGQGLFDLAGYGF